MNNSIYYSDESISDWMGNINPEAIWIGYNSRSNRVQLPEPSTEKTKEFIAELRNKEFEVREKEMR